MRPIALIIKKACDIAFWGRGAFFFVWRAKDLHEFCIEEYSNIVLQKIADVAPTL